MEPSHEQLHDWWLQLSEASRQQLMANRGVVIPAEIAAEVERAGPSCSIKVQRPGEPSHLYLRSLTVEFVDHRATLQQAQADDARPPRTIDLTDQP